MGECDGNMAAASATEPPPSRQWSGESRMGHFVGLQATAMAVSSSSSSLNGRFVLLGGKKQMALVDLEGGSEQNNNNDKRMLGK